MSWRTRNYNYEKKFIKLNFELVEKHPLQIVNAKTEYKEIFQHDTKFKKIIKLDVLDPLTQFSLEESIEPLSVKPIKLQDSSKISQWKSMRSIILTKHTSSEKLLLVTMMLANPNCSQHLKQQTTTLTEKIQNRLEQLDEPEEGAERESLLLTKEEYITRISEFNHSLAKAWTVDQKVLSLKITIQCCKLLMDANSALKFYPSKLVLVSDVLDNFGLLVFERILDKSNSSNKFNTTISATNIKSENISETAKETCRNWFYKIASIRELLPRMYIEASLLRCYIFLDRDEPLKVLKRLVYMARGIGDCMVGAYFRCYLIKAGVELMELNLGKDNSLFDSILKICISDLLFILPQQISYKYLENLGLKFVDYYLLIMPAIDWMIECLQTDYNWLLQKCKSIDDISLKSVFILSLISFFPISYLANFAIEFYQQIKLCNECNNFPLLISSFGLKISENSTLILEESRKPLYFEVWQVMKNMVNNEDMMSCVDAWTSNICSWFSIKEVEKIYALILSRTTENGKFPNLSIHTRSILNKILSTSYTNINLKSLITMDCFMPFMELLQDISHKVQIYKQILQKLKNEVSDSNVSPTLNDSLVIDSLLSLSKLLHDRVDAMTPDQETEEIGGLISWFVASVDFGPRVEDQLNFYVECRASFISIDVVTFTLVTCVNKFIWSEAVRYMNQKRRLTFVRACLAYCYITIASLNGVIHRIQLSIAAAESALINACLGQADAFIKYAITDIIQIPRLFKINGQTISTQSLSQSIISRVISLLLLVPDAPDQPTLHHFKLLLNTIDIIFLENISKDIHTGEVNNVYPEPLFNNRSISYDYNFSLVSIQLDVLVALATYAQAKLPYEIFGLDANDALYAQNEEYMTEINKLAAGVINRLTTKFEKFESSETVSFGGSVINVKQYLAFVVINRLIGHFSLDNSGAKRFLCNMWMLANGLKIGDVANYSKLCQQLKPFRKLARYVMNQRMKLGHVPDIFDNLFSIFLD